MERHHVRQRKGAWGRGEPEGVKGGRREGAGGRERRRWSVVEVWGGGENQNEKHR
jgi:hypothetical protein